MGTPSFHAKSKPRPRDRCAVSEEDLLDLTCFRERRRGGVGIATGSTNALDPWRGTEEGCSS